MRKFSLIVLILLLLITLTGSAVQAAPTETGNSAATTTVTPPVGSSTAATAPVDSSAVVTDPGGVKPVTPTEFVAKVNNVITGINTATSGLILPVATFAMLISIVIIIMGALVGHHNLRRYGWGGLFLASFGLLLFWGLPVILGLIQALATRFTTG